MELVKLLEALIKLGGSDLHLQAGAAPMVRVGGDLKAVETPPLEDSQIRLYMQQMSSGQAQIRRPGPCQKPPRCRTSEWNNAKSARGSTGRSASCRQNTAPSF